MQRKMKSRAAVAVAIHTACNWGNKQMEWDEGEQNPYSLLRILMQWIGRGWGFPDAHAVTPTPQWAQLLDDSHRLETLTPYYFNRGLYSLGSKASSDKAVGPHSDRSMLPQNQKDGHVIHSRGRTPWANVHTSLGLVQSQTPEVGVEKGWVSSNRDIAIKMQTLIDHMKWEQGRILALYQYGERPERK